MSIDEADTGGTPRPPRSTIPYSVSMPRTFGMAMSAQPTVGTTPNPRTPPTPLDSPTKQAMRSHP